jgi:hypothetical protein
MSQEHNDTEKKAKRTQRNRPILVTANDSELSNQSAPEEVATLTQVAEPEPAVQSKPQGRRLPGFFSTVGKKEEESATKEVDAATIAKARLARATHGKAPSDTTKPAAKEEKVKIAQPASSNQTRSTPAKPAAPFKTRHIIGIAIYLLGANFIGGYEGQFLNTYHLNQTLAKFPLFGGTVIVQTSTIAFLLTLVIILVLLARFDLIPRSLGALGGTPASRTGGRSASNSSKDSDAVEGTRQIPPAIKQGVQGKSDDLYRAYRNSQRRDKKR